MRHARSQLMSEQNRDQIPAYLRSFQELIEIIAALRGPGGCPWDKEQTQKSLTQYAIEEAYELAEAIESGGSLQVQEELGDFLFQVILQSQVAQDEGRFNLQDVIQNLNQKMIARHPHVFSGVKAESLEEVWKNWELQKKEEAAKSGVKKPLFSYPRRMPALQASYKIGVKTEGYKFDWSSPAEVFAKVREEFHEVDVALQEFTTLPSEPNHAELEHEIGDLLFSVSQLARHVNLEPEQCLRAANRRFEERFNKVLEFSGLEKEEFAKLPTADKEMLWSRAKTALNSLK